MILLTSNRRLLASFVSLTSLVACGEVRLDPFDTTASTGAGEGAAGGGIATTTGTSSSPTTTTSGGDGGGGSPPTETELPVLLVAQAGGVALWSNADKIGSDVLPTATLAGISSPRKLARRGSDAWVYTQGDTSLAKILKFPNIGAYAGQQAAEQVTTDVPTESGATNVYDFRVDSGDRMLVEHIPLSQPFLPEMNMFMHWQRADQQWIRTDFQPYWRSYAFNIDESQIFAGTAVGIQRFDVDKTDGTIIDDGWLTPENDSYPLVAFYEGSLYAVSSCTVQEQGETCFAPRLRIWRELGSDTPQLPDVVIDLETNLEPCAMDVGDTGLFLAMCSGIGGPIAAPPKLVRFGAPSALWSGSTPIDEVQLPNEPRELAVLPAPPEVDDAPFNVFVRCDDRIAIARDYMGNMVLAQQLVNGVSTTYDMLVID